MNINIKDIITLDDNNEYVVINKIIDNNIIYYYLMDINDNKNVKFCYEDNNNLIEINDKQLLTKLILLFTKNAVN